MEQTIGELSVVYNSTDMTWNVPNFCALSQELGFLVESPMFSCADAGWHLILYPNGKRGLGTERRLAISLKRSESHHYPEHRVQYTLGICRQDGQVYEELAGQHHFNESASECASFRFVDRTTVQYQALSPTGELSVFCRMFINNSSAVRSTPLQGTTPNPIIAKLQRDFLRMLRSENYSDVILDVMGARFRAHRTILKVRSAVFASLFASDAEEKGEAVVTVDNCDSDTFPDFLQYLYTGRVEALNSGNVFSLYSTADAYDVSDLKEMCLEYMTHSLSLDTFFDVMSLALRHRERELKLVATEFFARNVADIIRTAEWLAFLTNNCTTANELFIAALDRF